MTSKGFKSTYNIVPKFEIKEFIVFRPIERLAFKKVNLG